MKELFILPLVLLTLFGMAGFDELYGKHVPLGSHANQSGTWKTFSTYEEMAEYVKNNTSRDEPYDYLMEDRAMGLGGVQSLTKAVNPAPAAALSEGSGGSGVDHDYSQTNIQVAGVDEADIVKTDGDYIYALSKGALYIVKAHPAEDAAVVSRTDLAEISPHELFISGERLAVFGSGYYDYPYYDEMPVPNAKAAGAVYRTSPWYGASVMKIMLFDISEPSKPEKIKEVEIEGSYSDSRMVGDYVYTVVDQPFRYDNEDIVLPMVGEDGNEADATRYGGIRYFDCCPQRYYGYTALVSLNVKTKKLDMETVLSGSSQAIYMMPGNLYITTQRSRWIEEPSDVMGLKLREGNMKQDTVIHKIAVKDGSFDYKATGEVPGYVLNQFSMDEYEGYFRVATTTGEVWGGSSKNNVYVLNANMEIIGTLEDLAPGEKIYSARFMGERCYLVTFKKVDPLFVIDLKDPTDPKVIGKLKIPGYSDYLHPYDKDYLIGIGKDAVPSETGDFAWYAGMKISLFDVSDVEHPKEVAKYEIGDRGTESEALQDHKAFLFDKERNLLVLPITLAEAKGNEDKKAKPREMPEYGEYTFQGAYVFDISPEGIELRGRITHESSDNILKAGYYYESGNMIRRSLYIDNTLYTISDDMIKANDLNSLKETAAVKLAVEKKTGFCGRSTKADCSSDAECHAGGCSGQVCQGTGEDITTTCEYRDCYDADEYAVSCGCVDGRCVWA